MSYPARSARRDVEFALRTLEAARSDIRRRLTAASVTAPALDATLELFVHDSTGDFTSATGNPAWVAATTRGRRIDSQPLEHLRRRRVLEGTLRHELAHVVAEALSRGRAPRWLVEGVAIHFAGEGSLISRNAPKRKPMLDELEQGLHRESSAKQMRELYAAAYNEVLALIRKNGESAVWQKLSGS